MRHVFVVVGSLPILANCTAPPQSERDAGPTFGAVRVVEEVRIGMLDGPSPYVFGQVADVEATLDGAMFVYDAQANTLRMYAESGDFIRDVAGPGEGPGELARVAAIDLTPQGQVAVWDPENLRISVFAPDGTLQASHHAESSYWGEHTLTVDRAGNYYVKAVASTAEQRPFDWEYEWLKLDREGEFVGTVSVPPENPVPGELFALSTPEGFRYPFPEATRHTINRAGEVVAGRNTAYSLSIHGPDGPRPLYAREAVRIAFTRQERDLWETARSTFEARGSYGPIPLVKPYFRELVVDHDGRLWVDRHVGAVQVSSAAEVLVCCPRGLAFDWPEPPTFDVITEDGTWWATVEMPLRTMSMSRRGNHVWGRLVGSDGEHYVVRWRLEPIG